MKRGIFILVCLVLLLVGFSSAMPPYESLETAIKSGQIIVPDHNIEINKDVSFDLKSFISSKTTNMVDFKVLVILVDFDDKPASTQPISFDKLIFEYNLSNTNASVREFYRENSYGQLDIVHVPGNLPSELGWNRAPRSFYDYVNRQWNGTHYVGCNYGLGYTYPNNSQGLFEELIDIVNPYVDFSQYDNDGNSYVDGVVVVHSGRGAEFTGNLCDIWSHKWAITSAKYRDGVWVQSYSIQPEYWNNPGDITIGVYAHEIGHLFGLPDLYDLDNSANGIGKWSLMSGGSWNGALGSSPSHFDAWSKIKLGFATPQTISTSPTTVNFPNVEQNPTIYKLWKDNIFGSEYFLVENRQKIGYDTPLPNSGLLIWHIDEAKPDNRKEWWPGKPNDLHLKVALEQSDGLWEIEHKYNQGNGNDVFPGTGNKREFTPTTLPDSSAYLAGNTYVKIDQISDSASTMTARLSVSSTPSDTTPPTITINNPVFNQTFTGNITLNTTTSDNIGISRVEFYFDSNLIGQSTTSPYQIIWNSKDTSLGAHNIYAKAFDTSGNSANSQTLNISTIYCGDMDKNTFYDVIDLAMLIDYAFRGREAPVPLAIGDANGDGIASDVLDINYFVDYIFRNGEVPASCNTVTSITQPSGSSGSPTITKPGTKTTLTTSKTRTISANVIDEISDINSGLGLGIIVILVIIALLIVIAVRRKSNKTKHRRK